MRSNVRFVAARLGRAVACALALALLILPATPGSTAAAQGGGTAEILWDEWGTPHVFADDAEGLFRAFGWAQMHSHGNLLLRLLAQARGSAAESGGPQFLASDQAVRIMGLRQEGQRWYAAQTAAFRGNIDAFADGINGYAAAHRDELDDTFSAVLPITGEDVMAHVVRVMFVFLSNSSNCPAALPTGAVLDAGSLGSNGWAIGPTRSASGNTLLLANPHLAWGGEQTLYEAHLVGPGYDFYGAAYLGFPVLTMGFNDDLGWAHTVGTLDACDVFALTPAGGGYVLDGAPVPFETSTETVRVRRSDDTLEDIPLTLRRSIHGPVVEQAGNLLAIRIASVGQTSTAGLLQQWWDMGHAHTLAEFQDILRRNQLPMFDVVYADRDKHVFAAAAGQVPRRPATYAGSWAGVIPGDAAANLWSGVHTFEELPQVADPPGGYVQNSNSPPWSFTFPRVSALSPSAYPAYMAPQKVGWRERRGLRMIDENRVMSLDDLVRLKHSTHMELADRVLPELIPAARQSESALTRQAADVLASWDRAADAQSRGSLLFATWVSALGPLEEATIGGLFRVPEDPADPLGTPSGLANPAAAVSALDAAAQQLQARFGRLDVPWGDVARLRRGSIDLPANGFPGDPFGVFRVLVPDPAVLFAGEPAPVVAGDSFVAAVEFSDPVRAQVLMTYGNASQPGSPHLGDQLQLAARAELRPAWRTRADIEAHLDMRTEVRAGAPPAVTGVVPEETPVGTQVAWVLEVLNLRAGALTDAELTDRLSPRLTAEFPPAELRAAVREWATTGPFTYLGYTRAPTDTQAVALLLDKHGVPFAMPLAIDAAPPGRITGVNLVPVPAPPGVEPRVYSAAAEPERQDGLVDLDGRSIYISCRGSGGPTVLLDSGLGDSAAGWFGVESAVAEFTRVCSYDRPNTLAGASDPAPTPRTGQDAADDLHALLEAAGNAEPVVLAAHSIGGHIARLYAAAHPADVAGLVLVDASHEDLNARLAELVGPELRAEVERELAAAPNAEGLDLTVTAQQVRAARVGCKLPALPFVVLTRGLPNGPAAAETQLWRDLQADLVTLVPGAQQVLAGRSGHYIHQSQPELIVEAIRGVVTTARESAPDETMPASGGCTPR